MVLYIEEKRNSLNIYGGTSIPRAIRKSRYSKLLDGGKVIGLWYTGENLEKTPHVNIEDALDVAMITKYHPLMEGESFLSEKAIKRVEEAKKKSLQIQMSELKKGPFGYLKYLLNKRNENAWMKMIANMDKGYIISKEIKKIPKYAFKQRAEQVIKKYLLGNSRKFADIAEGNFLACYNLYKYFMSNKGKLEASGAQADVTEYFGNAEKFLDSFIGWTEEQFPHVKFVLDEDEPLILMSDRKIEISG